MARLSNVDLLELNRRLDERTPQELILWARDVFGDRLASLSALQESGTVICHMLHALKLEVPVLFVDTGVNFQETLDTRDRVIREYRLNVVSLRPELTMEQQTAKYGVLYLTHEGQEQCCAMRKNEPLAKVKGQYDAMIGSLRRAEGGRRDACQILSVDVSMNLVRVNPLANMTDEQLHLYIAQHDVILNPLHAQGFSTISCNRCTTPVLPHEQKRAGRWRHLGSWAPQYCGINPSDRDPAKSPAIDLPPKLVDRIFGRETDFAI